MDLLIAGLDVLINFVGLLVLLVALAIFLCLGAAAGVAVWMTYRKLFR